MKKLLKALWAALIAYPDSWDDYIPIGRWLVYKKLLVIAGALSAAAAVILCWWLARPEKPYEIPVFYIHEDRLTGYSGEAVLVDEQKNVLYRGQVAGGLRSGYGREVAPPGEQPVYEGDFFQGRYHGQGTLYQGGALLYKGGFQNGVYSGRGVLYKDGQEAYRGEFLDGKYCGGGILFQDGQKRYEGAFLDGLYDGQGVLYGDEGQVLYSGGFRRGMRQGQGVETSPEGVTVYEGEFANDLYDGQGRLYAGDGSRLCFEGSFVRGRPDRTGSIYNAQGQLLYQGPVLNGRVDYLGLLGLPIPKLQETVKELPLLYYGDGFVGYLYRELGFAMITRYDYSAFNEFSIDSLYGIGGGPAEELSPSQGDPGLFAQPADNLVANLLLVQGGAFQNQLPEDGVQSKKTALSGFQAFLGSRLESIEDPSARLRFEARVLRRGDHLYEVGGLPEKVAFDGDCLFKDAVYYYWSGDAFQKGGAPQVIFLEKAKFGG